MTALALAHRRAKDLGNHYIGTEHLLSGLMRCGGGPGALILQGLIGGSYDEVRDAIEREVTKICGPTHWMRLESEVAACAESHATLLQRKLDWMAARMEAALAADA